MKMDSGDGCTIWMYLLPLNCVLKNCQNGKFMLYFTTKEEKEVGRVTPSLFHSKIAIGGVGHLSISFF